MTIRKLALQEKSPKKDRSPGKSDDLKSPQLEEVQVLLSRK